MQQKAQTQVTSVFVAAALILGFAFAFAVPAKADTVSDLQAQITALMSQISGLQGKGSTTTSTGACFTFTRNLKQGSTGAEVKELQKFLNSSTDTQVATKGAGSMGNENSNFGPATKKAVMKFQEKYAADILTPVGLTKGTGTWGAGSRAKANALCTTAGATTGTTTGGTTQTPTGAGLVVAAATQPANALVPKNASRVPFTTFTITNTSGAAVTVNGVMVQRTGPAIDAVFTGGGVILLDETGTQLGVQRTFNSDHTVTAGDPFTIAAGATKTITVAGNFGSVAPSDYSGQVVSVTVTGINTTVPVTGTLPITGASQTLNGTLSIGTVTPGISSFDPNNAQTKNIGDTGVKFSGIRLTANNEDVKLYSVRFRMNGSISSTDLSNMVGVVDGTSYPAAISTDGRYYTISIPGGLLIQKGFSKDVYIQGDVTGSNASGRTVELDIDRKTDVYLVGQSYGYGIQPDNTDSGTFSSASTHGTAIASTTQPWFQGSTVSITGVSVTSIGKANEVAAQNVAVNVPNQVLGGFVTDLKGEGISVQQMVYTIATSSSMGAGGVFTNVTIVDEKGSVVAGPIDAVTAGGGQTQTLTFTNTVNFPTGRHVYTLKGKVWASATNGSTFYVKTTPSSGWTGVTGLTTGNTVSGSSLGSGDVQMNTMTVRGSSLALSVSATPAAQTIVAGSQDVVFANIQLDASQSGEDIRVSNLPLMLSSNGSASTFAKLTSGKVYDGSTVLTSGSNVVNPSASSTTFTFDNSITVAKGTVKTLTVKFNVASDATATYSVGIAANSSSASFMNATGVTSGNSVVVTSSAQAGQNMAMGNAGLAISKDSSSPSASIAAGGTTGVTLGAFTFRAGNDSVQLQKVGLSIDGNTASSSDLTSVSLWNGSTQVGTVLFTGSSLYATSTLSTPLTLAKDADTVITVKADLAGVGTSQAGTAGHSIKVNVSGAEGVGVGSGVSVTPTNSSSAAAGVTIFKSFPIVAQDTLSNTGAGDGKMLSFKVTANNAGPVTIGQVKVTWSGTATVSNVQLYGYTDGAYGSPISQYSAGLIGSLTSGTVLTFSTPVVVPAGQTYYFAVKGSVSGSAGTAVSTTLNGDGTASSTQTVAGLVASNFVWSGNSTTTPSSVGSPDWSNGYGLSGFTTSNIVQSRTN